jgi:SAM-dependent methyltransferase
MLADNVYESPRMAAGYAFSRPSVHPHIIRRVRETLGLAAPVARALDIGCGAGLSTAALEPLARSVVGLEPARAMLAHRRAVAPRAAFVAARAEQLPFSSGCFDIVTAAGSLNYVDLGTFLPDLARVLTDDGVMVVYDFSAGRRLREDDRLDAWFGEFERRYPAGPGYDMDARTLPYRGAGLRLTSYAEFDVAVPMTRQAYVAYVMSETGVELAVARGISEPGIREWCESSLAGLLTDTPRDVLFEAYLACVRRRCPAISSSSSSPA